MDLRQYFRKIREIEAGLSDPFPVVSSLETPDGGKAGIISEIPRSIAAKMIVEGRAVLASEAERDSYRQQQQEAKAAAEKADLAKRLQVAFISERNLNSGSSRRPPGISEK
ncbi:MAG TPA: hypothetical protein VH601_20465 [Bryobacteraceae bacterium]